MNDIPPTRYRRVGVLSARQRRPHVDLSKKTVTIFFPISAHLAYITGFVLGDGSITNRRLTFFNSDTHMLSNIAEELGKVSSASKSSPRIIPAGARGVPSIEYPNSALARLLRTVQRGNFELVKKMTRNRRLFGAFLAGLFDSEGSVGIYHDSGHPRGNPQISIANSERELLGLLQGKLRNEGIIGTVSLSSRPKRATIGQREVKWTKPTYRLRFAGWSSVPIIAKLIIPHVHSMRKSSILRSVIANR